ncbi:MAG: hypothetical protein JNM83_08795 [Myxococcales bacterium]|nr:hypothetical protein [Myxococcales bacterium]
MPITFSLEIPGFLEAESLGSDGVIERYEGQYQWRRAVAMRLDEATARVPAAVQRFMEVAERYESLCRAMASAPPRLPYVKLPPIIGKSTSEQLRENKRLQPYIVLELPKPRLSSYALGPAAGRMSEAAALRLIERVAQTLVAAHGHMLFHCALTPDSVLLFQDPQTGALDDAAEPVLLGLGCRMVEACIGRDQGELPSPSGNELKYRAPELRDSPEAFGEPADVFSLAKLLRALLPSGAGGGTRSSQLGLRPELAKLLARMEGRTPSERCRLTEVLKELRALTPSTGEYEVVKVVHKLSDWSLSEARYALTQQPGWLRIMSPALPRAQRLQIEDARRLLEPLFDGGLVPVVTVGEQADGAPYIFSKLRGELTLRDYVQAHGSLGNQGLSIVEHLARILWGIHKCGALYLGLCPENIVLKPPSPIPDVPGDSGPQDVALLLSEVVQPLRTPQGARRTVSYEALAPPATELQDFLAPEQYEPQGNISDRADVYALGSLLYFVVTGRRPPPPGPVVLPTDIRVHADLLPKFAWLVGRLRDRRPTHRPDMHETVRTLTWLSALNGLLRGTVLKDIYRIERPLAQGGMNDLFVAQHLTTTRTVVLKIPFPAFPIARTTQEVECAARASEAHPDVVSVQDFGELAPEVPYLQMDLIKGILLSERLQQRGGRMSEAEASRLAGHVAAVMDKVHRVGVVHRDLKPWNFPLLNLPKFLRGEFRGKAAQLIPNFFGNVNKKSSTELLSVGSKSVTSIAILCSPSII